MVLSSTGCKVPWALRRRKLRTAQKTRLRKCRVFFGCAPLRLLPTPNPLALGFGVVRGGTWGCGRCDDLRRRDAPLSVIARPVRRLVVAIRSPFAGDGFPDSHTSDIGHWFGMTKSKCVPRRGLQAFSKNALALCGKTAPQSSHSLPRKHSFLRPGMGLVARVFRRKMRAALAFFFGVGYTVGGNIEKRPFPACGNRRFGSGRFSCAFAFVILCVDHIHHLPSYRRKMKDHFRNCFQKFL